MIEKKDIPIIIINNLNNQQLEKYLAKDINIHHEYIIIHEIDRSNRKIIYEDFFTDLENIKKDDVTDIKQFLQKWETTNNSDIFKLKIAIITIQNKISLIEGIDIEMILMSILPPSFNNIFDKIVENYKKTIKINAPENTIELDKLIEELSEIKIDNKKLDEIIGDSESDNMFVTVFNEDKTIYVSNIEYNYVDQYNNIDLTYLFDHLKTTSNIPLIILSNKYIKMSKSFNNKLLLDDVKKQLESDGSDFNSIMLYNHLENIGEIRIPNNDDIQRDKSLVNKIIIEQKVYKGDENILFDIFDKYNEDIRDNNNMVSNTGTFYIVNKHYNNYLLLDLIMNNKLFNYFFNVNERFTAHKQNNNIYITYEDPITKDTLIASVMTGVIDQYKNIPKDLRQFQKSVKANTKYITVNIIKSSNISIITKFRNIFTYLLTKYDEYITTDIKEDYNLLENLIANIKSKSTIPNILKLEDKIIDIDYPVYDDFQKTDDTSGWTRICSASVNDKKYPLVIESTLDNIEGEENINYVKYPYDEIKDLSTMETKYWSCQDNSPNNFVYFKLNSPKSKATSDENKKKFPYFPCCSPKKNDNIFKKALSGEKSDSDKFYIKSDDKQIENERKGHIHILLNKYLKQLCNITDQNYDFVRNGVTESNQSILDCLNTALNKSYSRDNISSLNTLLSKQEMYNFTNDEIKSYINNEDIYLDPKNVIRLLEKRYQSNIFLFDKIDKEPNPQNVELILIIDNNIESYKAQNKINKTNTYNDIKIIHKDNLHLYDYIDSRQIKKYPTWFSKKFNKYTDKDDSINSIVRSLGKTRDNINIQIALPHYKEYYMFPTYKYEKSVLIHIYTNFKTGFKQCEFISLFNKSNKKSYTYIHNNLFTNTNKDEYESNDFINKLKNMYKTFFKQYRININCFNDSNSEFNNVNHEGDIAKIKEQYIDSYGKMHHPDIRLPVNTMKVDEISHSELVNESYITQFINTERRSRCLLECFIWKFSNYLKNIDESEPFDDIIERFKNDHTDLVKDFEYSLPVPEFGIITDHKIIKIGGKDPEKTLDYLIYSLKLLFINNYALVKNYYKKKYLSNYYKNVYDFRKNENEYLFNNIDIIYDIIKKSDRIILHDELMYDTIDPYFIKMKFPEISEKIYLCQVVNTKDDAMYLCNNIGKCFNSIKQDLDIDVKLDKIEKNDEVTLYKCNIKMTTKDIKSTGTSDLYDENIVFQFFSGSKDTEPGMGKGETIPDDMRSQFNNLSKIKDWRIILSNFAEGEFVCDGKRWNSVEHFYQASKFERNNPEFYDRFSLDYDYDSNPDLPNLSQDPLIAKCAGGKSGKCRGKLVRSTTIQMDEGFIENRRDATMEKAMKCKFTQIPEFKKVLIETKNAKLVHSVRGNIDIFNDLMRVRKEIQQNIDNIYYGNQIVQKIPDDLPELETTQGLAAKVGGVIDTTPDINPETRLLLIKAHQSQQNLQSDDELELDLDDKLEQLDLNDNILDLHDKLEQLESDDELELDLDDKSEQLELDDYILDLDDKPEKEGLQITDDILDLSIDDINQALDLKDELRGLKDNYDKIDDDITGIEDRLKSLKLYGSRYSYNFDPNCSIYIINHNI